jgi:aminoglycoside phosphotransferase (APT) family kinase protein
MMHDDQIDISDSEVSALIRSQFPEWAQQPIRRIESSGTVNAIFRIGDELAARFPLRDTDPEATRQGSLEDEARATAEFARHSPVPAPVPVAIGSPGPGYPFPWAVQTWLPGTVATDANASGSAKFAYDLAALVRALREVDTGGRLFQRGWRGGDLRDHDEWVQTSIRRSAPLMDVSRFAELWDYFRELPRTAPDVMSHGDLTPSNVLVDGGRLVGVLDCGGFGPADPALDVIAGWHLLDDSPRAVFRAELQCDDLEWERSKAWAFEQSLSAVWYYVDSNPGMYAMGRRTLSRIMADSSHGTRELHEDGPGCTHTT